MVSLLVEKAVSSSSVHSKGMFGLSRCLNGDIISVLQKQYATWFTNPYYALTYDMLLGVGKSLMEAVYLAVGLIP